MAHFTFFTLNQGMLSLFTYSWMLDFRLTFSGFEIIYIKK